MDTYRHCPRLTLSNNAQQTPMNTMQAIKKML